MKYDKALVYQPPETKEHFYKKLRVDFYKDGNLIRSIEAEEKLFEITKDLFTVWSRASNGQLEPIARDEIIFQIPMKEIVEFKRFL